MKAESLKVATQDVYLTQKQFDRDTETCLTILKEKKGYYVCEYTSVSLHQKIVNVYIK